MGTICMPGTVLSPEESRPNQTDLVSAFPRLPFYEGNCKILVTQTSAQFAVCNWGFRSQGGGGGRAEPKERWGLWGLTSELRLKGWEK